MWLYLKYDCDYEESRNQVRAKTIDLEWKPEAIICNTQEGIKWTRSSFFSEGRGGITEKNIKQFFFWKVGFWKGKGWKRRTGKWRTVELGDEKTCTRSFLCPRSWDICHVLCRLIYKGLKQLGQGPRADDPLPRLMPILPWLLFWWAWALSAITPLLKTSGW